jgi:hypothetical protein
MKLHFEGEKLKGKVSPDAVQAGLALLHDRVANRFKGLLA